MTDHLSVLDLERVVCGEAPPTSLAHLAECAHCTQAVAQLRGDQALVGSVPYERAYEGAVARARPSRPRWGLVAGGVALAVAATLVLVLRPSPAPEGRLKGSPELIVVDRDDEPVSAPRVRDRIGLVVSGGTEPYLAVFQVESGRVTPVWPTSGGAQERPRGGRLPVEFEVTEGSFQLIVLLGQEKFELETALDWLAKAASNGPPTEASLREAVPQDLRWVRASIVARGQE